MERTHQILWPRGGVLFVTLTYASVPEDYHQMKEDLHRFLTALRYHLPRWGAVWKLEFGEKTGRPHFHLLLIPPPEATAPYVPKELIDQLWGLGFTWIVKVDYSRIHVYLVKYTTKGWGAGVSSGQAEAGYVAEDREEWERWWGNSLDSGAISEKWPPWVGRFWGMRWDIRWAPKTRFVPKWAYDKAMEKLMQLEEKARENGWRLRGRYVVLLDKQILPDRGGERWRS
jgi:hypothetical protein